MSSYTLRLADASDETLRETYAWIVAYGIEHQRPPRTREVGEGLGLSYSGAYQRLDKMIRAGWVKRDPAGFILLLGIREG